MKIMCMLFFLIFNVALMEEIPKKDFLYNESDIIADSEVCYTLNPGGFSLGNDPNKFKRCAICKNGRVYKVFRNIWLNGNYEEVRKEAPLRNYLHLWTKLKKFDIWNMESKDPAIMRVEEINKLLEIYKEFRLEKSRYEFLFRIKTKEHRFVIYDITELKDKNYLEILKEINKFFKIKEIVE